MTGTAAFRHALSELLTSSTQSDGYVEVNARNLHDHVLGRGSAKNRMPICSAVMWGEFCEEGGDIVVSSPPKGKGGSLTLRFVWPRPSSSLRRGMLLRPEAPATNADAVARGCSNGECRGQNETGMGSIFAEPRRHLRDGLRIGEAALILQKFKGESLRAVIRPLQHGLRGKGSSEIPGGVNGVEATVGLRAALLMKAASAQVNEVVHALCILLTLPKILERNEHVEAVSLAAGNSGTQYDIETNLRVAEFKIIDWKGADSVREAQLFKDFFNLAESPTTKRKFLYVTGGDWALKALMRQRKCVGSLKSSTIEKLVSRYPDVATFADYYRLKQSTVTVVPLDDLLPEFLVRENDAVINRRELDGGQLSRTEDWLGNNAAFTCPVCSQVFIVSGMLGGGRRKCPACGKSTGIVRGGKNSGGTAILEY